jgi:serine/threonine-protein kinase
VTTPIAPAVLEDPPEVRPGTRLGRYEILLGIAQGGMARVWAAKQRGHRGFSKVVAIKTILPSLAQDADFEAMFLDEARVAAGVHHPNVCEIFDLGEENRVLYLAMEWVHGDSLARILRVKDPGSGDPPAPQRLNARIAARIISDACAGLHAAHELVDHTGQRLNVVHRDVSPQNILVSLDGNVKVTDFGVAKALGNTAQQTTVGQIKGKAAYMAPEQASGGRVDRRSDIFALGIVLYEVTTGKRPFHGSNQLETLKKLLEGRFEPPSVVVPGYPRELESIVLRSMAMDPMQRFPTADRMRVALEEYLARSGPVVTQTQVGAVVRERIGELVDGRRQHIQHHMLSEPPPAGAVATFHVPNEASSSKVSAPSASSVSQLSQVSQVAPISGVTNAAVAAERPLPVPRGGMFGTALLGVGIGLGVFGLIAALGIGAFLLFRSAPRVATAAAPSAAPPPAPVAAAPTASTAQRWVTLRSTPKDGVAYVLDGKPLEAGTTRVPRPKPGQTLVLEASAPGYGAEKIRIDEQVADELDVILVAEKAAEPAPAATGAAKPAAQKPVGASRPAEAKPVAARPPLEKPPPFEKPPEKPRPKRKADIPDNPF